MGKVPIKDLLKNPANVILLFIFVISVFVGSLFMFRIFYHKNDDSIVAMKELDDSLIYYVSSNQVDNNGEEAKKLALILDGKNKFNFILNTQQTTGFTGTYVLNDNVLKLFVDTYYSGKEKNDYRIFAFNILDDGSIVLDGTINNVTNYTFNKVTSNAFKSSGYSTSSVDIKLPKYTYLDNDNENLNSEIYTLNSTYSVIKFIDRINTFYTDSIGTSIYSNNNLSRRYTNSNQILSFILPNIDIDKTSGDVLNQLSNNIFKTYLNFNNSSEISYLGIKYIFDDNKYLKTSEVTGEKINNIIKRVINYQLIDQRLIIDEILIGYECTDGICKFYPITEINNEQKNYYDFTTSSINMDEILKNVDKINHYTWTFVNENDNFYFDSIQLN